MSPATFDYLARLAAWAFGLSVVEGLLLSVSWLAWSRVFGRASAGLRHSVSVAHFAGFIVLPALSLFALQGALLSGEGGPPAFFTTGLGAGPVESALTVLTPVVVVVWLAGVMICVARLILAWSALRKLERRAAPAHLTATIARLAASLGLRQTPAVAVADVAAPQVIGWRAPVVLVPDHITGRLTPAQLDAILLHELAHVRCGDYGWNLVQRGMLALLWFHPGAWFVYGRLRCERELRCDDLAARAGRSGADLAMALVRLAQGWSPESKQWRPAGLALSAASGELATRVDRLVAPPPPQRRGVTALPVVAGLGLCALAAGAGAAGRADRGLHDLYLASAFGPPVLIQAHDPAGVFQLRIQNGRVLTAALGPAAIPARVIQRGPAVTLIDRSGGPQVAVTVTPRGRIQWRARSPQPAP